MNRFARYVLRQHGVPLLQALFFLSLISVLFFIFEFTEMIFAKGIPLSVVGQLFLYSQGYTLALTAPCSVLVAVLLTFGRLTQDREIAAFRTSGVALMSIIIPVALAAVLAAVLLTLFNNHVLPVTNHRFANLRADIEGKRPSVAVREGQFNSDFPSYRLLVGHVNYETSEWTDVTIYQLHDDRLPTTITARTAHLSYNSDEDAATILLRNGEVHEVPANAERRFLYQRIAFRKHTIRISGLGLSLRHSERETHSDRELSTREMLAHVRVLRGQQREIERRMLPAIAAYGYRRIEDVPELAHLIQPYRWMGTLGGWIKALRGPAERNKLRPGKPLPAPMAGVLATEMLEVQANQLEIAGLWVEIHKKFAIPAACVVFVLLGIPIGIRFGRTGPAVVVFSLLFFLIDYLMIVGGEDLARHMLLSPFLGMWLPNLIMGSIGLYWTLREAEVLPR